MNKVFYFTKNTYQNGGCSDYEFFATAEEAVAAAKKDWSNLCSKDKENHIVIACICAADDEKFAQVMEREGWETEEEAITSVGYDFLAYFSSEKEEIYGIYRN